MMKPLFSQIAPAKINLHLHILSKRHSDGYHILDSLFVFADIGDELFFAPAKDLTLNITGDFAANLLVDENNSIIKAAHMLAKELNLPPSGEITLVKNLPIAAGIGGGTADAAAALIGLQKLWGKTLPEDKLYEIAAKLGSDVSPSLYGRPVLIGGTGDIFHPAPKLPNLGIILVNPMVPVSSGEIFRSRKAVFSDAFTFLPEYKDVASLAADLQKCRNDLTEAAITLQPIIAEAIEAISTKTSNCLLSRMSGSGSTCFGLYDSPEIAGKAAAELKKSYPDWWIKATGLKSDNQ